MSFKKQALVLVAEGSEELETVTVLDVLARGKVKTTLAAVTCGENLTVTCSRGVKLIADIKIENINNNFVDDFDIVVLPGGMQGAETFASSGKVAEILAAFDKAGKYVAAICAAPIALPPIVFGKRKITSHPCVEGKLAPLFQYCQDNVVVDGKLVTSRGPGTALVFSFEIIKLLLGKEALENVARPMMTTV